MKTIIILLSLATLMNVNAERWNTQEYKPCKNADYRMLEASQAFENDAIKDLIESEVLAHESFCLIKKSAHQVIQPAVCGHLITDIREFKFRTTKGALYTINVDASYRSCVRMRIIPTIKSLKFEVMTSTQG